MAQGKRSAVASGIDALEAVAAVEDEGMLATIAALASEKLENARLRREEAWLLRRIAEEDARLGHA